MKRSLLFRAAALLGAVALNFFSCLSAVAASADPVQLRIEIDRAVLPADTTERAVVKVALDCLKLPRRGERPPVNLALVIDRSGSMTGEKIIKAREAAIEAVRRLAPDDIVALVAFDHEVRTLVPASRVGDGRRLEEAIMSLEPGGNTALYHGVTTGANEVRRFSEAERYTKRIILLSDGLANHGPSSPSELGRLGASLLREGISVTTIGLGLGFNEDLMTQLAQRSDGNTYFVEHSSDLPRIFAAELGEVLSVVARQVVIEIEFPEGVRPLAFVGREGAIRGRRAELTLNQLYGGQEKFALIEVEVAPTKSGAAREIARAKVSYEDAVNGRAASQSAARSVQFSAKRVDVVASADHKVQADYAANTAALAKDKAVALVDAGRRDEAVAELRRNAESLHQIAQEYRNVLVGQIAAPSAQAAKEVEQSGISNERRKAFRAESAQTKSQQATGSSSGQR